jgi:hypothetical protein
MCTFIRNSAPSRVQDKWPLESQADGAIRGISQYGCRLTFINYLNFRKVFPHEEPFVILN